MERLTVAEAAARMGISQDAIRQRLRRGTLEHDKDEEGRVYVYLDADHDADLDDVQPSIEGELRERIRLLESELEDRKEESRRKDHLLAAALERIPAIEASPDTPSESPVSASESSGEGRGRTGDLKDSGRSWWRRWLS